MTSHPLAGARTVVLGASGFLGSRLVERLVCECGASVRVMVRRVMSASRIARFPIEIVTGDITSEADVRSAIAGADVVFNCAKGTGPDRAVRRAVDVDGPRLVVEAAAAARARVVHVSTMAVYNLPEEGEFDESSPPAGAGDLYVDSKRAGERAALAAGARLGVPVTVVQPTVIYGPGADVHGTEIVDEMRSHRIMLIDGGIGICNAVFVDDAVTGLLLAATSERSPGERILISGPGHPTWRDFFGHFENMLGAERTVSMSRTEALALWRHSTKRPWLGREVAGLLRHDVDVRRRILATREGALVRRVITALVPAHRRYALRAGTPRGADARQSGDPIESLPIAPQRPWLIRYMARRARARIDKAATLLGYSPAFPLDTGMQITGDWARWAGLLAPSARP
jgi:nucleoside-diphosphate-sugar epimerase